MAIWMECVGGRRRQVEGVGRWKERVGGRRCQVEGVGRWNERVGGPIGVSYKHFKQVVSITAVSNMPRAMQGQTHSLSNTHRKVIRGDKQILVSGKHIVTIESQLLTKLNFKCFSSHSVIVQLYIGVKFYYMYVECFLDMIYLAKTKMALGMFDSLFN